MSMSDLEKEVAELRQRLAALAERVRLSAVAEDFLQQIHEIREGDYFLLWHDFPTKLASVSSEGKWTYREPSGSSVEPFRIPDARDHDRLYTIAEVAEIVAAVKRQA